MPYRSQIVFSISQNLRLISKGAVTPVKLFLCSLPRSKIADKLVKLVKTSSYIELIQQ